MNLKVFILLCAFVGTISCSMLEKIVDSTNITESIHRSKRQIPMAYDFGFMDYAAYDYYDWVCFGGLCNLCDVLTGACCDPAVSANCFLPDSCANNPCLSGGTCVDTVTVSANRDFQCICIRGLTGKYCQLIDDFTPQNILPMPIALPGPSVGAPAAGAAPASSYPNGGAQTAAAGAAASGAAGAAAGVAGAGARGAAAAGIAGRGLGLGSGFGGGLGLGSGSFGAGLGSGLNGFGGGALGGLNGAAGLGGGLGGALGGLNGAAGLGGGAMGRMGGMSGMGGMGGMGMGMGMGGMGAMGMGGGMNPTGFGGRKKRELEIAASLFQKTN